MEICKELYKELYNEGKANMLGKINRILRIIILIAGGAFFICKLTEKKKIERKSYKEGFQSEEFDDIW